jgi:hypothetical protein
MGNSTAEFLLDMYLLRSSSNFGIYTFSMRKISLCVKETDWWYFNSFRFDPWFLRLLSPKIINGWILCMVQSQMFLKNKSNHRRQTVICSSEASDKAFKPTFKKIILICNLTRWLFFPTFCYDANIFMKQL